MHDLKLAVQLKDEVLKAAEEESATIIKEIDVSIGELLMVNPEQLEFWLEEAFKGSIGEESNVSITQVKPRVVCECGYEGNVIDDIEENMKDVLPSHSLKTSGLACPDCGSESLRIEKGKECRINEIVFEK